MGGAAPPPHTPAGRAEEESGVGAGEGGDAAGGAAGATSGGAPGTQDDALL